MKKIRIWSIFVILIVALNILQVNTYAQAPSSWDARDYGLITSVKEQKYGTCWAYTICAAAEADIAAQGYEKDVDLSENYIFGLHNMYIYNKTQCENILDVKSTSDSPISIINLAQSHNIFAYEKDYPSDRDKVLTDIDFSKNSCPYLLNTAGVVKKENAKDWISKHGALICELALDDFERGSYIYHKDSKTQNHVVTIIGWDDNISANNFKETPSSDGAWLVKNSWGTDFGDSGYCWLSYEDATIHDFIGLSVTKRNVNEIVSNCKPGILNYMNLSLPKSVATSYGAANMFKLNKGAYIDSFSLITKRGQYQFKIYALSNIPDSLSLKKYSPISAGTIEITDFDTEFITVPIKYKANADEYIMVAIYCSANEDMSIGCGDKLSGALSSYCLTESSNGTILTSTSINENCFKISLNINNSEVSQTINSTSTELKDTNTIQQAPENNSGFTFNSSSIPYECNTFLLIFVIISFFINIKLKAVRV